MDVISHGAWAYIGCKFYGRKMSLSPASIRWTVSLSVAPDLVQLAPVIGAGLTSGEGWKAMLAYFQALPHYQPVLAPLTETLLHHLHCSAHSALVAVAVTLALRIHLKCFWFPLTGWWLHILIDVFTHSADFYASPVFYPISQKGFDGVAWHEPWFLAINYVGLAMFAVWLAFFRKKER